MTEQWDWERVNWAYFDDTLKEVKDGLGTAQEELNEWVRKAPEEAGPEEHLYDALETLASCLVGLHHVVQMHHEVSAQGRGVRGS